MILTRFAYTESTWAIKGEMPLQPVNLLVGRNSVGKSKVIRSIGKIVSYLRQQKELSHHETVRVTLTFSDGDEEIVYSFSSENGTVTSETLSVNHATYLERGSESAIIQGESINPPANKLVLQVRRDTVQYPYIEKIMSWAEQACGFSFNEIDIAGDNGTSFNIFGVQPELYSMVKSLPEASIQHIIEEANGLGYRIDRIQPLEFESMKLKWVIFHEEGVVVPIMDNSMSKGMFRALYLLIYAEYLSQQGYPSLLVIDDFCEGLDYERSTLLGKLLFDFCMEHHIQLIASSNDTFLMDVVDLDYWNILQRNGSEVYSVNNKEYPDLFNDFRFTGLSNFDFFATDYIQRHLSDKADKGENE